jgi:hypothetical protein
MALNVDPFSTATESSTYAIRTILKDAKASNTIIIVPARLTLFVIEWKKRNSAFCEPELAEVLSEIAKVLISRDTRLKWAFIFENIIGKSSGKCKIE